MTLITLLLLAPITFMTRYLFLHPSLPVKLGPEMIKFLNFSAPAVLTAIWVPIIFIEDNSLKLDPTDPYLISATVAVIAAYKTKSVYWTIGVSMLVFVAIKLIG